MSAAVSFVIDPEETEARIKASQEASEYDILINGEAYDFTDYIGEFNNAYITLVNGDKSTDYSLILMPPLGEQAPRISSFALNGENLAITRITEQSDYDYIITGSVTSSAQPFTITFTTDSDDAIVKLNGTVLTSGETIDLSAIINTDAVIEVTTDVEGAAVRKYLLNIENYVTGKIVYYTNLLDNPVEYPETGNLYNTGISEERSFSWGNDPSNTLTLIAPAKSGTQRMHVNNEQKVNEIGTDYGPASEEDFGATPGSFQVKTTTGAYFITPKVEGPAKLSIWTADGSAKDNRVEISRSIDGLETYIDAQQYSSGASNKFIYKYVYESKGQDSVQFKILIQNADGYLYDIQINSMLPNDEAEITSFKFDIDENEYSGIITSPTDEENGKIDVELPLGTDITALTPIIEVSAGATVSPESGIVNDFSNSVVYTVTSQDGLTSYSYDVTVTGSEIKSDEAELLTLKVNGVEATIDQENKTASVTLPKTISLGVLPVEYTVSPAASTDIDDNKLDLSSGSAKITVIAENGISTNEYTVNATISTNKLIAYVTASGKVGDDASEEADQRDIAIYPAIAEYGDIELINASAYNSTDMDESEIKAMFANYDLVYVSKSVGGTNKLGVGMQYLVNEKPFLSTKAYFYSSGRWSWGQPTDGVNSEPVEYAVTINEGYEKHPIFNNITPEGNTIQVMDSDLTFRNNKYYKGVQGFTGLNSSIGGELIAQMIGTPAATAIHEINTEASAKYLLIAYCSDNYDKLTDAGIQLIKNSVDYLLTNNVFVPEPGSIGADSSSSLKAYVNNGTLYLSGIEANSLVEVYSLNGQKLQNVVVSASEAELPVNQFCIVRVVSGKGVQVIKVLNN